MTQRINHLIFKKRGKEYSPVIVFGSQTKARRDRLTVGSQHYAFLVTVSDDEKSISQQATLVELTGPPVWDKDNEELWAECKDIG